MKSLATFVVIATNAVVSAYDAPQPTTPLHIPVSVVNVPPARVSATPQQSQDKNEPHFYPWFDKLDAFAVYGENIHEKIAREDLFVYDLFKAPDFRHAAYVADEHLDTDVYVEILFDFDDYS
ncbi:hypothetical protein BCR33DRAFT_778838 [Rhizoclosmatium globosum]|uniref:Uncharacterized protein n=1 Tax=Rhizoclosmatium globosum TaxID=329046 RepID=A0A1Y2D2B3_9FUNG|nr:hypothetical protein BCR33DRAFT_778838 [Rhizoclosmatium globosum]|eukprot:ORY53431.1 hypothetical protein BCR33DRAFT_778838 [Rhizoclosmatium globosum]